MATVLEHLLSQTLSPSKIMVVNDGSTDCTRKILDDFPVTVVDLPYHEESHAGTPQMAVKFNAGFAETSLEDEDYMMILGSDDLLYQRDYVQRVVARMEEDPCIVVASGQLDGEVTDPNAPRGGGRLIKGWFWRQVMHNRYPEGWAWEDYINYKAAQLGYETRGYLDIKFRRLREAPRTWRKAFGDGRSMYALGFHWKYALSRCAYSYLRGRFKLATALFLGWASSYFVGVPKLDCTDWMHAKSDIYLRTRARKRLLSLANKLGLVKIVKSLELAPYFRSLLGLPPIARKMPWTTSEIVSKWKWDPLDVCVVTKHGKLPKGLEHVPVANLIVETSKPLGMARVRAIQKVKSKWLAFVDDDVRITNTWVKELTDVVEEDVGAVQGDLKTVGLGEKWDTAVNESIPQDLQSLKLGDYGMTHNTLIRTALVKDWRPSRDDLEAMEDYEITQHILKKGYRWIVRPTSALHEWSWWKLARGSVWGAKWQSRVMHFTFMQKLRLSWSYVRAGWNHLKGHGPRLWFYYSWFRFWCIIGLLFG